jgi:hypothetical protein
MKQKGLCNTCNADEACVLQGDFKVLECEEFDNYTKITQSVKLRPKSASSNEEITEAE